MWEYEEKDVGKIIVKVEEMKAMKVMERGRHLRWKEVEAMKVVEMWMEMKVIERWKKEMELQKIRLSHSSSERVKLLAKLEKGKNINNLSKPI